VNEQEFVESIDCRFPYEDTAAAEGLVDQACSISSNAAFMVAHELARIPAGTRIPQATLLELVGYLDSRLEHPLKDAVFPVVRAMVCGERISDADAVELMDRIKLYAGQRNALAIVYFAAEKGGDVVESACESILEAWRRHGDRGPS
jgi:hypothetical protein